MKPKNCLPLITALILGAGWVNANQVTWGGSFEDNYYLADGVTKLDSTFWFELGTFDAFLPTSTNVNDWAANWHVFDRAVAAGSSPTPPPSLVQFDPNYLGASVVAGNVNITNDSGFGVSSHAADLASHVSNSHPNYIAVDNTPTPNFDFSNKKAYVWVFNDRRTNVGAQWGLFTGVFTSDPNPVLGGNWAFPSLDEPGCACTDLGAAFYFSDITGNVVGTPTQTPPSTNLTLAVVPEPSSAILILATGLALLIKRRRLPVAR